MLITSIGVWAGFSRANDIVTDSSTKLQWQDDAVGSSMTWDSAIDYCENTLTLGGYEDWRLPNKNELSSIVDYATFNPSINTQFQNTASNDYWSSTTYASYTSLAWFVYFNYGYTNYNVKDDSLYVRCVRAGQ